MSKLSRRSFLKTAGRRDRSRDGRRRARAASPRRGRPESSSSRRRLPSEPLVAYVRDAVEGRGDVVSGLNETTFKDPALVKRMQKAAQHPRPQATARKAGGWPRCRPTAKHPRSARTRSPTTPTSTRSSARTSPTPSRSSPTTSRSRPGGRPELLRVRRRRPLRDQHRQRRRRQARHHLPVRVHDRGRATRTRSSTTPARSARSTDPNWNRRQFYTVTRMDGTAQRHGARARTSPRPPCNIGPRSTPNYAALANAADPDAAERREGVRRPAERRLLRRPRLDLRPRRPAAVPEPAPDPDARRRRASTR